ncbi:Uncharacterised protein [Mycobacteroides abscessus subsp. abscessus]|nr:Uncharacterised protein [Mycobacteroides abscessus subsp. abscessus]
MATRMLVTVAPATRCGPRYLLLTAAAESVSYGSSAAAAYASATSAGVRLLSIRAIRT